VNRCLRVDTRVYVGDKRASEIAGRMIGEVRMHTCRSLPEHSVGTWTVPRTPRHAAVRSTWLQVTSSSLQREQNNYLHNAFFSRPATDDFGIAICCGWEVDGNPGRKEEQRIKNQHYCVLLCVLLNGEATALPSIY
jgi:hypothetical protein